MSGAIKDYEIDDEATVAELKEKIAEEDAIAAPQQRIVFQGKNMCVWLVLIIAV